MGYEIRSESLLKTNSPEKDLGRDFLLPLTRKKRRQTEHIGLKQEIDLLNR